MNVQTKLTIPARMQWRIAWGLVRKARGRELCTPHPSVSKEVLAAAQWTYLMRKMTRPNYGIRSVLAVRKAYLTNYQEALYQARATIAAGPVVRAVRGRRLP